MDMGRQLGIEPAREGGREERHCLRRARAENAASIRPSRVTAATMAGLPPIACRTSMAVRAGYQSRPSSRRASAFSGEGRGLARARSSAASSAQRLTPLPAQPNEALAKTG